MFKKFLSFLSVSLLLVGCGSEPLFAIDFADPQLVKEANQIDYISDGAGHFYDYDKRDISDFINVIQHMKIQKIKSDPLVMGGSSIEVFKGGQRIISIGFYQHISINGNSYQYELDDKTETELKQLIKRMESSSQTPKD